LKKCSIAEGEEFRLGARKDNAGESVDSPSFHDATPRGERPARRQDDFFNGLLVLQRYEGNAPIGGLKGRFHRRCAEHA